MAQFPFLQRRRTPISDPIPISGIADAGAERYNPTVEVGRTGTINFNGFLTPEEYNRELQPPDSFKVYDRMLLSDPTIKATVHHIITPIKAAEWEVRPASDSPEHLEQAAFVENCLFKWMEDSWQVTVGSILKYLIWGCSVNEEVYQLKTVGWEYRVPGDGDPKEVAARKVTVLKKFGTRLPRTIIRWIPDADGELAVVQQQVFDAVTKSFKTIDIPRDKCLLLVNEQIGDDYWGTSILRAAYKPWLMLEGIQRVTSIGFERFFVGTPMARMNQNASAAQRTAMLRALEEIRSGERTAIVYSAGDGIDCDTEGQAQGTSARAIWIMQPEHSAPDTIPFMKHLESNIFTNILARFMDLGQKETGARATAEVQDDPFYLGLLAVAAYVCDEFNRGPMKHLIDLNYPNVDKYPQLVAEKIEPIDNPIIAAAAQSYAAVGMLTPDFETEQHVRKRLGFPDKMIDQEQALPGLPGTEDTEKAAYPSVLGIPAAAVAVAAKQAEAQAKAAETAAKTAAAAPRASGRPPQARTPMLRPASAKTSDGGGGTALSEAEQRVFDRLWREATEAVEAGDLRAVVALKAKDLGPLTAHYQTLTDENYPGGITQEMGAHLAAGLGIALESQVKEWALNELALKMEV